MHKILWGLVILLALALALVAGLQSSTQWQVGEVVRTPESRFDNLQDYPFTSHYIELSGYRVHYLDEGPRDGPPIWLLHGQPSWSYLYRHMITPLVAAGYRVVVPDLIGFGKSDKPIEQNDYSYQMHVDVMTAFVRNLGLRDVTFFGQDWGGLIGLRVIAEEPDHFARIMISNTGLPAAGGVAGWVGYPLFRVAVWAEGNVNELRPEGDEFSFARWVAYARTTDNFDMEKLFQTATARELSKAELAGYAAPFPDETHLAGARIFPYLVPSQLRKNDQVMREVYDQWTKPLLTAFGDSDPVTEGLDASWQERVPGAAGQPHVTVKNASHFIQEDQPERLVELLIAFIESSPPGPDSP